MAVSRRVISILQSSIKTFMADGSKVEATIFQFYKVRLKLFQFFGQSYTPWFQFYKVRLKHWAQWQKTCAETIFQFYKVRLKPWTTPARYWGLSAISILQSSIKTRMVCLALSMFSRFQFYKVRLKPGAGKSQCLVNIFQFYKVRLKPSIKAYGKRWSKYISILQSSIKTKMLR